jgi:micrococcal nuclease
MMSSNKSIFTILFVFIFFFACDSEVGDKSNNSDNFIKVTKVIDGDTFWADNGTDKVVKVRLIGVDAPESRKSFNKEVGYYGEESKQYLTQLLLHKHVHLVSDVDSLDRFGRTLSYVYLKDGTFVNAELIKNGYATVMTIPPNVKYADLFVKLQREARRNNSGLWK